MNGWQRPRIRVYGILVLTCVAASLTLAAQATTYGADPTPVFLSFGNKNAWGALASVNSSCSPNTDSNCTTGQIEKVVWYVKTGDQVPLYSYVVNIGGDTLSSGTMRACVDNPDCVGSIVNRIGGDQSIGSLNPGNANKKFFSFGNYLAVAGPHIYTVCVLNTGESVGQVANDCVSDTFVAVPALPSGAFASECVAGTNVPNIGNCSTAQLVDPCPTQATCLKNSDGYGLSFYSPANTQTAPAPNECSDGMDNDKDGLVDFDGGASKNGGTAIAPADPGCTSATDSREYQEPRPLLGLMRVPVRAFGEGALLTSTISYCQDTDQANQVKVRPPQGQCSYGGTSPGAYAGIGPFSISASRYDWIYPYYHLLWSFSCPPGERCVSDPVNPPIPGSNVDVRVSTSNGGAVATGTFVGVSQ